MFSCSISSASRAYSGARSTARASPRSAPSASSAHTKPRSRPGPEPEPSPSSAPYGWPPNGGSTVSDLEVGLRLAARVVVERQLAGERAPQRAGLVGGRELEDGEEELVVADHVGEVAAADDAARRRDVRGPALARTARPGAARAARAARAAAGPRSRPRAGPWRAPSGRGLAVSGRRRAAPPCAGRRARPTGTPSAPGPRARRCGPVPPSVVLRRAGRWFPCPRCRRARAPARRWTRAVALRGPPPRRSCRRRPCRSRPEDSSSRSDVVPDLGSPCARGRSVTCRVSAPPSRLASSQLVAVLNARAAAAVSMVTPRRPSRPCAVRSAPSCRRPCR